MARVLPQSFFRRPTLEVSQDLLGKYLVHKVHGREVAAIITEVEAYDGPLDKASHAHKGVTKRNAVMFGEAGHWYVYLCYGIHEMLNITTGPEGYPAAILIRGVVLDFPADSYSSILPARPKSDAGGQNTRIVGPGRVTKFLGITRACTGKSANRKTGLWIEDRGVVIPKSAIKRSPRVGVTYAGRKWAGKLYRFYMQPPRH